MKTIILKQPGQFALADTTAPGKPGPDEALVRIQRVGICGTDIHAFHGRQPFFTYPRILGHELAAEIVEAGPNTTDLKPGDRCAIEPSLTCGRCIACRRGRKNCCVSLQVMGVHVDGGMRDYLRVPVRNLHRSTMLTLDQLALVEMLCIGAHAVERAQPEPGEFVLVIGAGPIGLAVIQFAQQARCKIMVMDINEHRLNFCRQQFGIEVSIKADEKALDQIRAATDGDLPTAVFDATGNPEAMARAFEYPAHGGRLVFVGLFQGAVTFDDPNFHRRELTLLASRNSLSADFDRTIGLMESGVINPTPWITHRAASDELIGVFPRWLRPETGLIKAVVEW